MSQENDTHSFRNLPVGIEGYPEWTMEQYSTSIIEHAKNGDFGVVVTMIRKADDAGKTDLIAMAAMEKLEEDSQRRYRQGK